jgi:hypothetical protein
MTSVNDQLNNLAKIVKFGDNNEASKILLGLVNDKPRIKENWLGVARLAILSCEIDLTKQALTLFISQQPHNLASLLHYLSLLVEVGEIQVAKSAAENLFLQTNKKPHISHFLSNIYLQLGDAKKSAEMAKHTLETLPTSGQSWLVLTSSERLQEENVWFAKMQAIESEITKTDDGRSLACYYAAKSKIAVDNHEDELAFELATKANTCMMPISQFDGKREASIVNTIIANTPNDSPAINSSAGAAEFSPIFIVGLPRSGTSLLEQILCQHSKIIDGGEFNGMERAARCLTKGEIIGSTNEHFLTSHIDQLLPQIRENYVRYAQQRFGKEGIVVDKSLNNSRYLWLIKLLFPKSPIIHIERNKADVAWSCFRTHFSSGLNWTQSVKDIAQFMNLEDQLVDHWNKYFSQSIYHMQYENLVSNTESELINLMQHCGLNYEPTQLEFHSSKRPVYTASVAQVRNRLSSQSIDKAATLKHHFPMF